MKHIQKRLHTGLQLTNNNDEGELSCKLVPHPITYQLVQCTIKKIVKINKQLYNSSKLKEDKIYSLFNQICIII